MNQLEKRYEITSADIRKDRLLKTGAWSLPLLVPAIPALSLLVLTAVSGGALAALFFVLMMISLIGGFVLGLAASGGLMIYRSRWHGRLREMLAADGIRADELEWFMHEIPGGERQTLRELQSSNLLMADAYRDSLATKLTAVRIIGSAKKELQLNQRQQNKLKYSKAPNTEDFRSELERDFTKLSEIRAEAEQMKIEAEKRLHQIETAARHGSNFSETELALKKLSARNSELPLALESAKMEEEIRKQLENE